MATNRDDTVGSEAQITVSSTQERGGDKDRSYGWRSELWWDMAAIKATPSLNTHPLDQSEVLFSQEIRAQAVLEWFPEVSSDPRGFLVPWKH